MKKLMWRDMNSLNAIAGYLRCSGNDAMAAVLLSIQEKASYMLDKVEAKETNKMNYVKTVNVTNTKNVLVQVPGWIVKLWGLQVGNTLEVCYDGDEQEIRIRRPIYTDLQGRVGTSKESN